jgi:hypothetical protein
MNELENGLRLNGISEGNIVSFLKLREEAEKLGFTFNEYDEMDGEFIVSFSIPS